MFEASGRLPAVEPFDLRASIRFLGGFGACKGDQQLTDDTITKAMAVNGQVVVFALSPSTAGIDYRLRSEREITPAVHEQVRSAVNDYLSLADDLTEFYALAATDVPAYADLVRRLNGLHHVRFLTIAEVGVWAVLTQRTPRTVASALKTRITTTFGRRLGDFQAFPELADLAALTVADWFAIVRKERKAEYLHALVAGLLDLGPDYLRDAPYAEATSALRHIHGVGDFTASAILLRGLGRMNHVPLEMPSFADPAAHLYGPGNHATRLRHHYGPHIGYWSYYLRAAPLFP